jgi:hypothetical protein
MWMVASLIAVVITTAGSIYAHKREAAAAEWQLEEYKTQTNKETARLSAEGDKARAEIANANQKAEEARQKANEADVARLKLELRLEPRQIPADKQQAFIDAIKPYAGTSISLWNFPSGTSDTPTLVATIARLLTEAGWIVTHSNSLSGQAVAGVVVGAKANSGSEEAAKTLADTIAILGQFPVSLSMPPYTEEPDYGASTGGGAPGAPPPTVIIRIGTKP